jgi:hypothetical protein
LQFGACAVRRFRRGKRSPAAGDRGPDDRFTAYGFFCWFERSFLDHGYARAELIKKLKP